MDYCVTRIVVYLEIVRLETILHFADALSHSPISINCHHRQTGIDLLVSLNKETNHCIEDNDAKDTRSLTENQISKLHFYVLYLLFVVVICTL